MHVQNMHVTILYYLIYISYGNAPEVALTFLVAAL